MVSLTKIETMLISPTLFTAHRLFVLITFGFGFELVALFGAVLVVAACLNGVGEDTGAGEGEDDEEFAEKHVEIGQDVLGKVGAVYEGSLVVSVVIVVATLSVWEKQVLKMAREERLFWAYLWTPRRGWSGFVRKSSIERRGSICKVQDVRLVVE